MKMSRLMPLLSWSTQSLLYFRHAKFVLAFYSGHPPDQWPRSRTRIRLLGPLVGVSAFDKIVGFDDPGSKRYEVAAGTLSLVADFLVLMYMNPGMFPDDLFSL